MVLARAKKSDSWRVKLFIVWYFLPFIILSVWILRLSYTVILYSWMNISAAYDYIGGCLPLIGQSQGYRQVGRVLPVTIQWNISLLLQLLVYYTTTHEAVMDTLSSIHSINYRRRYLIIPPPHTNRCSMPSVVIRTQKTPTNTKVD